MAFVNQIILTKTAKETEQIGEKIAKELIKEGLTRTATCVCLEGNLGAGKTTFAKGFAKGLGIKEIIISPTFAILKRFKIQDSRFKNFYHIDAYRLQGGKDAEALNLKEVLANPTNLVLIEWPNNLKVLLKGEFLTINFDFLTEKKRSLNFSKPMVK
ncbi:tRNA (adenosine(37)-N6)-threonylcarbamoyltransferase complex ATPase subunit type 1 TsaE [bacterium (Candidatus Gribaldobacteria) CG23_combo_of_CG06-09_8_20_14_all_37_87_8]|uniref:tRNA threonylcarbamoyladenosine biosynthesis protein TsaE n=2 Tax=Candidatus Gribaldobacteria TaxID=2798536 RepID=A0A2G9ZGH0_9BACT|nr:MAG: tRNA (adenosine(37)-N6)-threonylcarbamoyltransferase complex ATPase subunit type 1 TsaE [Parcubacteria group bacterium CG1_02_37_13]PIP31670.1 MAG: tRNA (adenosine(37)-N6)-threonylcarbamoyltransferase complex ATPase subunit type 1 TsaE [bacterium (Candidatus Gribaldobacteria) CG23_combo_of_CG06-09_8_20_14_all_37_87_8]PIR89965.1 MAG: tRNA (adenosine(37)-N6)-threonylcarbamoyltransferase complex ATPase subunit type 1 TsaE [bacterium (Candidatus Gribaldobacteria) CG10_big_fil_rev_8_21_14_0_10